MNQGRGLTLLKRARVAIAVTVVGVACWPLLGQPPREGVMRRLSALFAETPEAELSRLRAEAKALDKEAEKDVKALKRAEGHYSLLRRRRVRGAALERVREPIYALRRKMAADEERAAEVGQRMAILGEERGVDGQSD